ncbi:MAG: CapA family protein [Candidatus Thermoplasmatota archaeon]|nr:CapA family protein [Candidatus Thermoplasmatota archaeon]
MIWKPLPLLLAFAMTISGLPIGEGSTGKESQDLLLVFMGDIALDGTLGRLTEVQGAEYPFEEILPHIDDADVTFANLESPVSTDGSPEEGKYCTFRMKPDSLESLRFAGIDEVSLSNNHCLDYGPEALNDTLVHLDQAGIAYAGIYYGETIENASVPRPTILISNEIRIGFLAYTEDVSDHWKAHDDLPGPMPLDRDLMEKDVKASRDLVDILIVSIHWRKWPQYTTGPEPQDIELCREIVDWGADIIMGHGPHTVHEIEEYKDSLIMYSLGNAAMDTGNDTSDRSYVAKVTISGGSVKGLELVPIYKRSYRYVPMGTPVERNSGTGLNVSREEVQNMYDVDTYDRVDSEWGKNDPRMIYATTPWYIKGLLVLLLLTVIFTGALAVLSFKRKMHRGK